MSMLVNAILAFSLLVKWFKQIGKKYILRLIATHKKVEIYFVVIAAILIKFLLSHVRSLEDLVACDAWLYHKFSGPSYYWIINVVESIDGGETCLETEFISNFLLNFRPINFIYYSKNCTVRYKNTNIRLTPSWVTMVTWLAYQHASEKQILVKIQYIFTRNLCHLLFKEE